MNKPKVEAIFPLTSMQQALLFHSLQEERDEGLLQVHCKLKGPLNPALFQQAWDLTMQRHPVLRTSIHWEKIKKPVQVVHPTAKLPWTNLDWSDTTPAGYSEKLAAFKEEDIDLGLTLSKAPLSRIALLQLSPQDYALLWTCHHILLDGWSAAIILKDLLAYYDAICQGTPLELEALPTYKSFFSWRKSQNQSNAATFWKDRLSGFEKPSLLGLEQTNPPKSNLFTFTLSEENTKLLQAQVRKYRVTLPALVQGFWALLLSRFTGNNDVVFGTTVSGRSGDFPKIESMAGLFMNVLPVRVKVDSTQSVTEWLSGSQKEQLAARQFEQVSLDQINAWNDWPGHLPLFDSLVVFENFPWENLEGGGVSMEDFVGGLTTTYPMTLVVKPLADLEFIFRYRQQVSKETVDWLSKHLEKLLLSVANQSSTTIQEWLSEIEPPLLKKSTTAARDKLQEIQSEQYVAPQNPLELKLAKIWETILGYQPIGVADNFFEIGGRSLLAIRMFAQIEQELGYNLPPILLLKHPTIQSLGTALQDKASSTAWSSIVPLRASGTKTPLFCVHAGGNHVFFYSGLAQHLSNDHPLYAIQPIGLDGVSKPHDDIEEMAAHYIREIRSIQAEGPYALLGTCFSNVVCLEMAQQLKRAGQEVGLLAMIDTSPGHLELPKEVVPLHPVRNLVQIIQKGDWKLLQKKMKLRAKSVKNKLNTANSELVQQQQQQLEKMEQHLAQLFNKYVCQPYEGKVTLIRSHQFSLRPEKQFHVDRWLVIAKGGLDVFVVEGHHKTMFLEPEVQHLAQQLGKCLEEIYVV